MSKQSPEINPAGIRLSKKAATLLYTQLYEQIRQMILSGRLRQGERLPASRNLAPELGVSRVIVSQAYEQLMMEGYLVGKTGSGTFVMEHLPDHQLNARSPTRTAKESKPISKLSIAKNSSRAGERSEIIPFQMGTPSLDQFPYKSWHRVGNKVLQDLKNIHLGYEDTMGYLPLRQAIASYLRVSRAVSCEAEQVIVVTGSQQGLNLVAASLLQKGDAVWMEDPGYPGAAGAFQQAGTNICPVPVQEDGIDIEYGKRHFGHAKLVYTTPAHQFPTGCTLSQAKRNELMNWAATNDRWIVEDDYDSEFRYAGRPLPSMQGADLGHRVIYSGTFSKVLFPGLRLAYLVLTSAEMIEIFRKIKENTDRQSPIMEQVMLARFMEQGYFLRHIRKMRMLYAERQKILTTLLKEELGDYLQVSVKPSGMHLLCQLSEKINLQKFKNEIEKSNLIVSFVNDYTLQHHTPPAITLGFTAFSKYKLKTGLEKLSEAIRNSLG